MTTPRFLQIHTLHSYTAALLNRDDTGLSKRLPYGDTVRTRISSQCLKRHWRDAGKGNLPDPHSLQSLTGFVDSVRSRDIVTKLVIRPLDSQYSPEFLKVLETEIQNIVYGKESSRQPLLLGKPEIEWVAQQTATLAAQAAGDPKAVKELASKWAGKDNKDFKDNIKTLRSNTSLPGGLVAALFGRMVTSDSAANLDAPVHVAHAFTVHAEQVEGDYFSVVNDLQEPGEDSGADHIGETELTSGLFYGYVVVDMPGLIDNCGQDKALAARVLHNLVYLIAEISPGAKRGSTAPYGRAELMLLEAGDRQPRSLAGAYREATKNSLPVAAGALATHLACIDKTYETGEERRYFSLANAELPNASAGTLKQLAEWAAEQLESVE